MAKQNDNGGSAFPHPCGQTDHPGMTLRDWFAGMVLANIELEPIGDYSHADRRNMTAMAAYDLADGLLAVRALPHEPIEIPSDDAGPT